MDIERFLYKGYLYFVRAVFLLFTPEDGNPQNFALMGAYFSFIAEADWDPTHKKYGYIVKTDIELASKWHCSVSTVWRWKKKLTKLGFMEEVTENVFKIKHLELFHQFVAKKIAGTEISTKKELIANMQNIIADFKNYIANLQKTQLQKRYQNFNISSKSDLSSGGLPQDDIDFINETVKEE